MCRNTSLMLLVFEDFDDARVFEDFDDAREVFRFRVHRNSTLNLPTRNK